MHGVLLSMAIGGTVVLSLVAQSLVQWRETELRYRFGDSRPRGPER